jgi:retinol dehydrogenase 14
MRPLMKTPAQGAATSIYLASAPGLEQVSGRYFASSKPRKSAKRSYDETAAARLWQVSADLTERPGAFPRPPNWPPRDSVR